jgi:hypothetical protein
VPSYHSPSPHPTSPHLSIAGGLAARRSACAQAHSLAPTIISSPHHRTRAACCHHCSICPHVVVRLLLRTRPMRTFDVLTGYRLWPVRSVARRYFECRSTTSIDSRLPHPRVHAGMRTGAPYSIRRPPKTDHGTLAGAQGCTPLLCAAMNDQPAAAERLIGEGCDVHAMPGVHARPLPASAAVSLPLSAACACTLRAPF